MNCVKPIMLKSGLLVPCGKCLLCQSQNRTEKSVLVQLHSEAYDRMPLFITLTYSPENLPVGKNGLPTLCRPQLSAFIKKYKRDFSLTCDRLTYFGCGEYGDPEDHTFRAHYHLIWFGDDKLHDLWLHDVHYAEDFMYENWQNGYVDVCEAQWSAIHYVTKYVMKDEQNCPPGSVKPFCVTSNGIGISWLKSLKAAQIRNQMRLLHDNRFDIYNETFLGDVDFSNHEIAVVQLKEMKAELQRFMPDFRIVLPSGQKAYLPRKLRRRLVGSFEHFLDNPCWLYNRIEEVLETEEYMRDNDEYDKDHPVSIAVQKLNEHIAKIKDRISKRNFNKRHYESI